MINQELKKQFMEHHVTETVLKAVGIPEELMEESKSRFCDLLALIEGIELQKELEDPSYKEERIKHKRKLYKEYGLEDPYEWWEQFEKEQAKQEAKLKATDEKIRQMSVQKERIKTLEDIFFGG